MKAGADAPAGHRRVTGLRAGLRSQRAVARKRRRGGNTPFAHRPLALLLRRVRLGPAPPPTLESHDHLHVTLAPRFALALHLHQRISQLVNGSARLAPNVQATRTPLRPSEPSPTVERGASSAGRRLARAEVVRPVTGLRRRDARGPAIPDVTSTKPARPAREAAAPGTPARERVAWRPRRSADPLPLPTRHAAAPGPEAGDERRPRRPVVRRSIAAPFPEPPEPSPPPTRPKAGRRVARDFPYASPADLPQRHATGARPGLAHRSAVPGPRPPAQREVAAVERTHRRATSRQEPTSDSRPAPPPARPAPPQQLDLDRLDRDLWRRFEKRIRVERARRGLG